MSDHHQTYDDLLADGWVPNTVKGVTSSRYTNISLCVVRDGRRIGCVQSYGQTLADARVNIVIEAARWLHRHEREAGTNAISHRRRDQSTMLRSGGAPHEMTSGTPSSEPPGN